LLVSAVLRLSDINALVPDDLANGDLLGRKSRPLTFDECFDLAMLQSEIILANEDADTMAKRVEAWLSFVSDQGSQYDTGDVGTAVSVRMLEMQRHVYKRRGCDCTVQDIRAENQWKIRYPNITVPPRDTRCNIAQPKPCKTELYVTPTGRKAFNLMCSGGDVTSLGGRFKNSKHRGSVCRFNHNNDPRLFLAPAKEEEINTAEPYMIRIHDFISDHDIEQFKMLGIPILKPGKITTDNKRVVDYHRRVSAAEELTDYHHTLPLVKKLRSRFEAVSGLNVNTETAEPINLFNYGHSGFIYFHTDYLVNRTEEENNRMATIIVYANDVDGGETLFPLINTKVEPIKGTAFLFYHKKRSGENEVHSLHGACPVLTGEKIILREHVNTFGQEFKRPCLQDTSL